MQDAKCKTRIAECRMQIGDEDHYDEPIELPMCRLRCRAIVP